MNQNIKRILVYTHNSIGLGHAFRTLAVITGIRKMRPDINFLVISSTSVPQIFFNEGIEVIKLPSVKLDIDDENHKMHSRYLPDLDLESIFEFRQRIILESFDFFKPDVLFVEHNMTGQMSELIPLLMKKWMRKGGPADFALVHICRGIMRWVPLLEIPYENPRHRSESINLGKLYDFMYVLEDREVIDINKAFLGNDPDLEKKITYLGKITKKVYSELPSREEALNKFGLSDKKVILVSLGRNRRVMDISVRLAQAFEKTGLNADHQVVMILDPYLEVGEAEVLKSHPMTRKVRFSSFVPDLVDLMHHSELVISRAGYNTANEILMSGSKAILIPEAHGGGEQEQRVQSLSSERIKVLAEEEIFNGNTEQLIVDLLNDSTPPQPMKFDKYRIGQSIVDDLESWIDCHRERQASLRDLSCPLRR